MEQQQQTTLPAQVQECPVTIAERKIYSLNTLAVQKKKTKKNSTRG
jgi:hypothetical protein